MSFSEVSSWSRSAAIAGRGASHTAAANAAASTSNPAKWQFQCRAIMEDSLR